MQGARHAFSELTFAHGGCIQGYFVPKAIERLYGELAAGGEADAVEARQLQILRMPVEAVLSGGG